MSATYFKVKQIEEPDGWVEGWRGGSMCYNEHVVKCECKWEYAGVQCTIISTFLCV